MNKLKFHYNLRLGKGIEYKELYQIKKDLIEQPILANVYIITIASNTNAQLDIYHSRFLIQKYYGESEPYVVGIARKKSDALEIIEQLMQECIEKRKDAELKTYILGE